MKKILIIILILFIPIINCFTIVKLSYALAKKNERYYQTIHCKSSNGQIEYKLKDNSRIDCLTQNESMEHDWARKWAECLGQALYYGAMKDKIPVCVLIGSKKDFDKFSSKIKFTSNYYNLPLKVVHIENDK